MLDMKYVSPEYQKNLEGLARMLVGPREIAQVALPGAGVGLRLCDPPEAGWEQIPLFRAVITPAVRHINRSRHGKAWDEPPSTAA